MFFIKYISLIMILICSTSVGFLLSKKYVYRLNELIAISKLIDMLKNKIRFTKIPLQDAFYEISKIQALECISKICYDFANRIKMENTNNAWNTSIEKNKKRLNLKKEDFELVKSFGATLGKTDLEGQISEMNSFKELLNLKIKEAEEERKKNEKLFKSLGTIIGLVLIIILF